MMSRKGSRFHLTLSNFKHQGDWVKLLNFLTQILGFYASKLHLFGDGSNFKIGCSGVNSVVSNWQYY